MTDLESPRLLLRTPRSDDAEALTALLQDPEISRWTNSIPWPYTLDDAHAFITSRTEGEGSAESFVWAFVLKESNRLAGVIGLHDVHRDSGRAELGYWIGEPFRGQGLTTEAARRVLSWAFEVAGFQRIQATYLPGNAASASVMRNIGMQPEGLLRGYGFKNGEYLDLYLQAVLKGDSTWISTDEQWAPR